MSAPMGIQHSELLTGRLTTDEERLRSIFTGCSDVVFHSFETACHTPALCVSCLGICDTERLERQVLAPLQEVGIHMNTIAESVKPFEDQEHTPGLRYYSFAPGGTHLGPQPGQVPMSSISSVDTIDQAIQAVLEGQALLILEGEASGTVYPLYKAACRAPEEPAAESTIRGSRDGFTESLATNLSLLRKRIKTPALKMQTLMLVENTKTSIVLTYMEGIIDPQMVKEVEFRLGKLQLQNVLESQYIEEGIIDQRFSPFPQMIATERPDVVAAN